MAALKPNELIRLALSEGWRERDSKSTHTLLLAPNGVDIVAVPATPSDHRGLRNVMAEFKRAGLDVDAALAERTKAGKAQAKRERVSVVNAPETIGVADPEGSSLAGSLAPTLTPATVPAALPNPVGTTSVETATKGTHDMATKKSTEAPVYGTPEFDALTALERKRWFETQAKALEEEANRTDQADALQRLADAWRETGAGSPADWAAVLKFAPARAISAAGYKKATDGTSEGDSDGEGTTTGGKTKRPDFNAETDTDRLLEFLKGQSDKVRAQEINVALNVTATKASLDPLVESAKIVRTGTAPAYYYALA